MRCKPLVESDVMVNAKQFMYGVSWLSIQSILGYTTRGLAGQRKMTSSGKMKDTELWIKCRDLGRTFTQLSAGVAKGFRTCSVSTRIHLSELPVTFNVHRGIYAPIVVSRSKHLQCLEYLRCRVSLSLNLECATNRETNRVAPRSQQAHKNSVWSGSRRLLRHTKQPWQYSQTEQAGR
jgi:hypothetical protein